MSRSMLRLIYAKDFFDDESVTSLFHVANTLQYVEKDYGLEVDNFNYVPNGANELFSHVLGEQVIIDEQRSGVFRKPMLCVHFESFENIDEWCFVVALEQTTFNLYHHLSGAKTALDGYRFNYKNMHEWDYELNIQLKPNEAVFFRPWLFHSIDNSLVQYYRLLPKQEA